MKFVCQQCGSKYAIANDTLRSKIIKIKCKKCGQIIELRDDRSSGPPPRRSSPPKAGPPEPRAELPKKPLLADQGVPEAGKPESKAASGAASQDEKDRAVWFVAIKNAPAGPMSARKVHAHRRKKQITDGALAWKEGMAEWTPMRSVKELVGLLAAIDVEESRERQERISKVPRPEFKPKPEVQPAPEPAPPPPAPKPRIPEPSEPAVAPPAEAAPVAKDAAPASAPAAPAGAKPVDVRIDTRPSDAELEALFSDFEDRIGSVHSLAPPKPANQNQNRIMMLASIGFFCVALFTLGVALFSGSGTGEANTVGKVERVIEKVVYRDRIVEAEAPRPEPSSADKGAEEGLRSVRKAVAGRAKADGKKATDAKTRELMARLGMETPVGNAPIGGDAASRRPLHTEPGAGGALKADQVKDVVNGNKSQLKSCYERSLRTGEAPSDKDVRVDFSLTVGSSGVVKSASVSGEGAVFPELKRCLAQSVRNWVFPPASADSPVEFPFLFTPK